MKSEKIAEHLKTHQTDYQSVISLYKARSKEIEQGIGKRRIERLKRIAEWRERLEKSK